MAGETRTSRALVDALESRGMQTTDLSPVGVRPPLDEYVAQLWDRRHFIWMDARHRVATQNSRNRLGNVWLLLRPLLDALMYYVVFSLILNVDRGMENYPGFLIIGVLMFRSTMRSISQGPATLQNGRAMIRAFTFPRAALAISAEVRDALQMVYTVAIVIVAIMVIPNHEQPELTWLLVPVIFLLQFLLNLGISFLLARIGFLFPDLTVIMGFTARFLMYGSGVIFPVDRFLTHPVATAIIEANPIYHLLVMYREVLMDGVIPSPEHWLILGAWSVGLAMVGFIVFWRGEATYGGGQ